MNKLIITRRDQQYITALFSGKEVLELHLEDDSMVLGNIYIGKVKNVVKNINAAFVDYKEGKTGYYSLTENPVSLFTTPSSGTLKAGDEIIVQIEKDAVKTKDPVLSANLNFSGKYAVLTSAKHVIGFSSKIHDTDWKDRLREELAPMLEGTAGVIIRTNAYTAATAQIKAEIEGLLAIYQKLKAEASYRTCYSLLHEANTGYLNTLASCPDKTLEQIITDCPEVYETCRNYLSIHQPEELDKLQLYQDSQISLSNLYSLETVFKQALQKRVWLKSGGYLVIEQTEAMVVIDVNTGKYSKKKTLQDTIRLINQEAAKEICHQLRLRNLSGIIMIDFIDMKAEEDKQQLMAILKRYAAEDPVKTMVVDMTALNLVEMTRKKGRRPLAEQLQSNRDDNKGGADDK
ncbi:MAG: ribonuclease E/G [Lachnospiraceae bacterium]